MQEGMGKLGTDQLQWLEADLKSQPASRPIVVFAHIPLWSVYPDWGWGTADSAEANVQSVMKNHSLAVVDSPLDGA
jgi:3',5'-cyclic AMP phosphodiesterase CpdA